MLTIFGATGYTGRFAALYMRDHAPAGLEWAIAARNPDKLAAVHAELGEVGANVPQIVADAGDPASIDAMAARSSVIVNMAGPFALHGTPVVDACVRHGTDYCDITGETPWVRDLIDAYHETASERGIRIVPMCGMDSVPADIGAFYVVRQIRDRWDAPTASVRTLYTFSGGVSGGTLASILNIAETGEIRRLADPVLLNPAAHRTAEERARNPNTTGVSFDETLGQWTSPFLMGAVNTRVVRRSAALFDDWGESFGPEFRYSESMRARTRTRALVAAAGLGALLAASRSAVGRSLVRALGPSPGEGPSEAQLAKGFLRCSYVGETADGRTLTAEMKAQGDPGYRVTIAMVCEAGLALALDKDRLPGGPSRGGILTPATALGARYIERLDAAGVTLETC